jgi:glycine cleavage system H protein
MNIPKDLKYTEDHEWIRLEGDIAFIGITDYAQGELGDVVYVDLPAEGDEFGKQDVFGSIEAVKAASDLYCPITGKIVETNGEVVDAPETINKDPYGSGWMVKIKVSDVSELDDLLDAAGYEKHIGD